MTLKSSSTGFQHTAEPQSRWVIGTDTSVTNIRIHFQYQATICFQELRNTRITTHNITRSNKIHGTLFSGKYQQSSET